MTTRTLAGMVTEIDGEGAAVLLVHGLGGTSNTWQPLMSALGGMQVIRPDLPGAGRSVTPEGQIDVDFLVAALKRLADAAELATFDLVGHSFGALIAQHLAAAIPERVTNLVLFGPIVEPAASARERLRGRAQMVRQGGMAAVADPVTAGGLATGAAETSPAAFAFVRESHMRQCAEGFAKSCEALAGARRADPAAIKARSLIVTGEEDAIAPPVAAYGLAEEIGRARAEIIPACGHWATVERPEVCRRLITAFLRQEPHR
ncbi:MAG: alpha/beta fold hydrolase [Ancalomicrobiaceae bacterium]|nr:alpha/beta fold hydrolase [Ancalomicrobiaceae bacterium]